MAELDSFIYYLISKQLFSVLARQSVGKLASYEEDECVRVERLALGVATL